MVEAALALPFWILVLAGGMRLFQTIASSLRKQEKEMRTAAGKPPSPEFRDISWPGAARDP